MENTTNLKLPLLIPNQSQKEITHNEALIIIDNILQNGVIDKDLTTPPTEPNNNDIYIVGNDATGDWENKDKQIAFYDNGWRFIEPREGFIFWVNDEDKLYTYNGTNWNETVAGSGGGSGDISELNDLTDVSITSASNFDVLQHNGTSFTNTKSLQQLSMVGINTEADTTNKLSLKSDAVLFDKETSDIQIKVNKATSTDAASYLFQTGYSGRAEFGLTGSDDFTLKVSNDGTSWNESFKVDCETGNIDFKKTITNNGRGYMLTPQNTDLSAIGYFKTLDTVNGQITLPSGGTWMVWGEARNGAGVKQFQWGGIFAGGTQVGGIAYYNDGFALKIQ